MTKMKELILMGAIVAVFTSMVGAVDLGKIGVKKGKGGAMPFNFDAPAVDQAESFVHVSGGRHLKGIKKLGIVNFTVEYTQAKKATITTRNLGTVATATSEVEIPDVDPQVLVRITDALYDQLVADLQGAGIEIIPFETLKNEKRFKKLSGAQKDSPWVTSTKDGRSVFVGAKGMPIYLDNPERADFLKGLGMSFGTNTRMHETLLANDLGGHLLSVNMVVDFADLKTKGSLGFADIETNYEQYMHGGNTRYRFIKLGQPDLAMLTLKQGMLPDINPYANVKRGRWKFNWKGVFSTDDDVPAWTREEGYSFRPLIYYRNCINLELAANALFMAELYKERGLTPPASAAKSLAEIDGAAPQGQ